MDSLRLIFPLAWRNLWRNSRRSMLTMLAIFVAVFSMVVLGAFMRAWGNSSVIETINNLTGHGQIHQVNYLDDPNVDHRISHLPNSLKVALQSNNIRQYAKRVRVPAMLKTERESAPVELYGIEPQQEDGLSFIANSVVQGHYFNSNNQRGIIIGEKLAARLQTKLGRRLVVMSQGADGQIKERGLTIIGLFHGQANLEKSVVFISLTQAQTLLGIGSDFSELVYRLPDEENAEQVAQHLQAKAGNLQVKSWNELQPFAKAMLEMSNATIFIWIIVSFGVVSFGLINTLLMAVFERMREFGLLQALGMKPRWLLLQLLLESSIMVGLATIIGLVAGVLLILAFANGINLGLGASYLGSAQLVYPKVDWQEIGMIGISVILLGLLASLYPAIKAAREVPVKVLAQASN